MNLKSFIVFLLMLCAFNVSAQHKMEEQNELLLEEERPNYGQGFHAHRFAMQRPQYAKKFQTKRLGDHLFLDFGIGLTKPFSNAENGKNGKVASIAFGDWLTPEHGVRVGAKFGSFYDGLRSVSLKGATLDYLMNISALTTSGPTYDPQKFELLGVMGVDLLHRSSGNKSVVGWGGHVGLRGQYNIPNTIFQIYAEPRFSVMDTRGMQISSLNSFRSELEVLLGVSVQNPRQIFLTTEQSRLASDGCFLNNTFLYVAGGPQLLMKPLKGSMQSTMGARLQGGIGKWFNRGTGVRISGYTDFLREEGSAKNKGAGLSAEAIFDLNYAIKGYEPERRFWVNGLLGASLARHKYEGIDEVLTYGWGVALQPNLRLNKDVSWFLEPRVDVMKNTDNVYGATSGSWAVVPSLLTGVNIHNGSNLKALRERNAQFTHATVYDHLFIEGAMGAYFSGRQYGMLFSNPVSQARPKFYAAIGKWFTPTSGMRIWGDVNKPKGEKTGEHLVSVGVDYLWNLSNTFRGYDPQRRLEFQSSLGVNFLRQRKLSSFAPGVNVGLRAQWNANRMVALFLEPQLRVYEENEVRNNYTLAGYDFVPVGLFGMQLRFNGYTPEVEKEHFATRKYKHFVSAAAGFQVPLRQYSNISFYGPTARLTYGQQFSPLSSYRLHGLAAANKYYDRKQVVLGLGADYMLDLMTLAYGYNEDRRFTINALTGVMANVSTRNSYDYNFYPEVYVGAQLALRVADRVSFFYEPQLRYDFTDQLKHAYRRDKLHTSQHLSMTHMIGMNTRFEAFRKPSNERAKYARERKTEFFSVAMGAQVPMRIFHQFGNYGPLMRLSYGKQNTPFTRYRYNATMEFNHFSTLNYAKASLGADYMFDFTSWIHGYDSRRLFSLRPYAGADLSVSRAYGNYYLFPEVSVGAQVGLRISNNFELFYEGQLKYAPSKQLRFAYHTNGEISPFRHVIMTNMIGLNYRVAPVVKSYKERSGNERDTREFVSLSAGTNINSATFFSIRPGGNKLGFSADVSYGRWLNGVSGFRIGLDKTQFKAKRHGDQQHWYMLHADAMCDLVELFSDDPSQKSIVSCDAFLGVGLGISVESELSTNYAPALLSSIQVGANLGKHFNIYIEPSAQLFGKSIWQQRNDHPFELTARVMLGTKYNF